MKVHTVMKYHVGVSMVRLTLMYYIDFVAFMENPDKTWNNILAKEALNTPPEQTLFD